MIESSSEAEYDCAGYGGFSSAGAPGVSPGMWVGEFSQAAGAAYISHRRDPDYVPEVESVRGYCHSTDFGAEPVHLRRQRVLRLPARVPGQRAHSGELDLAAARPGAYNVINADGSAPSWYANFAADSARGQGG